MSFSDWIHSILPYETLAIVIVAVIMDVIFNRINKKAIRDKRNNSLSLIFSVIKAVVFTVCILLILSINGVNISSVIAGLGIVSVIVGLALQDFLKDIIMGFHIIADDFYKVGDVIKYGDVEGIVRSFTLRSTKIEDIESHSIITFCNRNIDHTVNVSEQVDINVPLSYKDDPQKIHAILRSICLEILDKPGVKGSIYKGTQSYESSFILYKVRFYCDPSIKPDIRRSVLMHIQNRLNEEGIIIPFTQIDIHTDFVPANMVEK